MYQLLKAKAQRRIWEIKNQRWKDKAKIQLYADKHEVHIFFQAIQPTHSPTAHGPPFLQSQHALILLKNNEFIQARWTEHFEALIQLIPP